MRALENVFIDKRHVTALEIVLKIKGDEKVSVVVCVQPALYG
jgi:hypothetical protein